MRLISPAPPSKPTAAGANALHKLEDIAAITGGAVYSKQSGFTLATMAVERLGWAAQVRVTAERTAIIDGYGSPDAVQFRPGHHVRRGRESRPFHHDERVPARGGIRALTRLALVLFLQVLVRKLNR
jgi:chaperonin GroEL (HSP60 family)